MVEQNTFMETVRSVAEIIKTAKTPLTKDEILEYLQDMELSKEQQELVYQYLVKAPQNERESRNAEQNTEHHTFKETAKEIAKEADGAALPKSVFFQMYLTELEGIKPCSEAEEDALYAQLISGEKTAVEKLSHQWLPRVLHLARKRSVASEHLQDVIQEGNLGLFLALQELSGSGKKVDYRAVLTEAVEEAMEAYLLDTENAVDNTESILAKATLVREAQKYLAGEWQRMPTTEELSEYTRLPVEELEDILAMSKENRNG